MARSNKWNLRKKQLKRPRGASADVIRLGNVFDTVRKKAEFEMKYASSDREITSEISGSSKMSRNCFRPLQTYIQSLNWKPDQWGTTLYLVVLKSRGVKKKYGSVSAGFYPTKIKTRLWDFVWESTLDGQMDRTQRTPS